ncbi:myb-like domain, Myb/SANT-like DNA-binding domain protein [Artemisia annua]|uniref:Myb-like domain, Myb/SANT-like DNA-binding domain protein n=1 Tax=Artemisia annua TaxID=35608 RepID=A0A2U1KR86_ARTAN|nr:myb-like domain, Myb/SANT-like DNA-binding domain protein [Artemisia annua]
MYPQSPPFFYTQQPLPQIPTNFDPFELRYTQQKRRERVSEPLPIHDDTDDDEDLDHVDMEEEALAKAWIKISVDREIGDRQTKEGFWKRVLKHFKILVPRTQRTKDQLNSKWTPMHTAIAAFNVYERANLDFEKQFRKAFAHSKVWHILKDQPKWKEQPLVSQTQESTGSSKKRKSSESSSAQTPTNETPINVKDFACDLPNLNENPTPSRQSRGKKKMILEIQAEAQLEVQKKKDAEYFKFIDGEVYNRDMKFVMEPHDNIPDPAFKEFVINRKREICAQHGWPCSL